jgi:hypothetical protein
VPVSSGGRAALASRGGLQQALGEVLALLHELEAGIHGLEQVAHLVDVALDS